MAIPSSGYSSADFSNPGSDLTDFVAVVDLADMPADFWTAVSSSDGARGRVAKDDGTTELASEWVDFDDVAETGLVFFKWSGTLSSTGTSTVRIYPPQSGNSSYAVTNTFGRNNVWTDYEAVFHLNEDPSGTAPQMIDATGNGYDATSAGSMTSGDSVSGQLGNGLDFDGSDDEIDFATDLSLSFTASTLTLWIYSRNSLSELMSGQGAASTERLTQQLGSSRAQWWHSGNREIIDGGWTLNDWEKLTYIIDGSTVDQYTNKTAGESDPLINTTAFTVNNIAGSDGFGGWFDGIMQHVFYANITYSVDRLNHEFDNQSDPTTFWGTWTWTSTGTSVNVSDSVGVSDSLNQVSNDFTQSDSVSLADTIAEVLNSFTVSDSVSVADTNDFDIEFIIADSVSVTDSLNNLLNEFTLQDTITASDSVSVSQGVTNINVSDSLSISDSIASVEVIFTVQDAISLLDSVSTLEAQVVVVDTVSFTESVSLTFKEVSVSDAISIVDSVTRSTIGDATKMVITAGELYNILLQASEKYNIELEANNLYNIALTALQKIDGMSKVVGEVIPLKATFTDDSDVATTPGEPVEVSVKQPDGTLDIDSVSVSEGSTGVYEYEYTTSQAGQHYYKFVSNDGGVEQGTFFVKKDEVG